MKMKNYLVFAIFVFKCDFVGSFLPNHINPPPYLEDDDYTLSSITERGILLAVAEYFENTPLEERPPINPGDLTNLNPLTPETLYEAYYGGTYHRKWDKDEEGEERKDKDGEKVDNKLQDKKETKLVV